MNTNELLDLIKARERMCHTITDCDNCPLNNRFCRLDSCYDIDDLNHLISTVKEWDAAHPALEEVDKGKIMNKDCIFYTEIQDMHATVSQCRRSTKFADCPCGNDCEHYISIELARSMDIKPVVRCKDCKYHTAYRCPNDNLHWTHNCTLGNGTDGDDYYCADGEKRE